MNARARAQDAPPAPAADSEDAPLESETERVLRLRVEELELKLSALMAATGLFASDTDLDSPKGDSKILFDPKGWRGRLHKGLRMSQCSPEFLEFYAKALQWSADNPKDDRKFVDANRRDARRARSWAIRHRLRGPAPIQGEGELPHAPADRANPFGSGSTPAASGGFGARAGTSSFGGGKGFGGGSSGFGQRAAAPPTEDDNPFGIGDGEPSDDDDIPF